GRPGPGPRYVPASTVRIRAGTAGPVPNGRVALDGVVDRVQATAPLFRVRVRGDGYLVTGYVDGGGTVPDIGERARALVDPAAVRVFSESEPSPIVSKVPATGRLRSIFRSTGRGRSGGR
ncbi:MAG: hypothetical protein ABFC38_07680, partial [Methanospirillum sp.]